MRCNCACTQNKSSRKIRSSTLPKGRERKVMMRPYYGFCFVVAGVSQMSGKCPWSICSHSVKSDRFHANSIMFHQMHFHTILLKKNISPPPTKKENNQKINMFTPCSPAFSHHFPQHFPYVVFPSIFHMPPRKIMNAKVTWCQAWHHQWCGAFEGSKWMATWLKQQPAYDV